MGMQANACSTLAEWREEGLDGKTQAEIALDVGDGCSQPWVSQVELGHLPGHRHGVRLRFIRAYGLQGQEAEFIRMVRNASELARAKKERKRMEAAIQKPVSETEPLFATAATDLPALISGLTREAQQILIQQYEARKQA